jgi:peptidylprolyl isomerase
MRNASKLLIVVAAAALAVGGCSSREQASDEPPGDTASFAQPTGSEASEPPESEPSEPAGSGASGPACTAADVKVDGAAGAKPTITLPDTCSPPTELVVEDLVPGTGPAAAEGSTVMTNYLLMTCSDSQVVDNSFDRGQPFPVENLGQAPVIPGWNEGMIGIKQGGRRLLLIPPDLGYGPQGQSPIKPNETLVFVVDAVQVQAA